MDINNVDDKTSALINGLAEQSNLASEDMNYELGEEPAASTPEDKKARSFSKALINILIIVIFIIGVAGSLFPAINWFSMTNYLAFIEKFAVIFIPMILSVATGRTLKNFFSKKYKE